MSLFKIEGCRSCHHAVIWARTDKGKMMPIDAVPSTKDGSILLTVGRPPAAKVIPDHLRGVYNGALHTSHFATCPQADEWRQS